MGAFQGGSAVLRIPGLQRPRDLMVRSGFEHDGAVPRGLVAYVRDVALTIHLGWERRVHSLE